MADASKLDFEDPDLDSYDLTVKVTDNGTGALTDTAIVSIAVTDAPPIVGTPGDDNLFGTNGDDVLIGDLGNDVLRGGADNDVLNGGVVADFQSDIGFRDTDRADYSAAASGVNVNLASGIAQDGDGGTDTLIGVEGGDRLGIRRCPHRRLRRVCGVLPRRSGQRHDRRRQAGTIARSTWTPPAASRSISPRWRPTWERSRATPPLAATP